MIKTPDGATCVLIYTYLGLGEVDELQGGLLPLFRRDDQGGVGDGGGGGTVTQCGTGGEDETAAGRVSVSNLLLREVNKTVII